MVIDARCKRTIRDTIVSFFANYYNRTRNCKWNHSFSSMLSYRRSNIAAIFTIRTLSLETARCTREKPSVPCLLCVTPTHVHTYVYMNSHPEYMRALRSAAWVAACVSVTWKPIDNGVRVRENKEGSPHMSLRPSFLDVNRLSRWPMERKLILVVCLQAVFMNVRGI